MYSVGWLVAYITVLLIVAEPCRNAGKYTLGDILSFRTDPKPVRAVAAISTVAVSTFYLTAQMVGAGKLMQLLLGIPYKTAIIGVGILMVGYVVFGGMTATTWVQIIKAGLLMTGAFVLSVLVLVKCNFNPIAFFDYIVNSPNIQDHVSKLVLKDGVVLNGVDAGQRFLEPGLFMKTPLDQISLGMALVLGTAGMPHILMRFFTVPTAQAARKSVIIAMFIIGGFYVLTTLLGFGAAIHVTPQGITAVDKGGNMATMMLAQQLGRRHRPDRRRPASSPSSAPSPSPPSWRSFPVWFWRPPRPLPTTSMSTSSRTATPTSTSRSWLPASPPWSSAPAVSSSASPPRSRTLPTWWRWPLPSPPPATCRSSSCRSSGASSTPPASSPAWWSAPSPPSVWSWSRPNMTYPKKVADGAKKVVRSLEKKQAALAAGSVLAEKDLKALEKGRKDYEANKDGKSMLGLDKPLFTLKNPGIISIPLGFLAAIFGCLGFPEQAFGRDVRRDLCPPEYRHRHGQGH